MSRWLRSKNSSPPHRNTWPAPSHESPLFALFCLVSLLLIPTAQAQTSAPRPILAADALGMLSLQGSSLRDASLEIVPVESRDGLPPDANFTQAARLTVRRASPRPWHIQLQATPNTLVREGERVLVSFWARGALLPEASAGSRPQIEFRMEKAPRPISKRA